MADLINNSVATPIQIFGRAPNGQLQAVTTDGNGNISIVGSSSGTVTSGTAGQLGYYATSSSTISGNASATVSAGVVTASGFTTTGAVSGATFATATNGSSTASPAVCGSAASGIVQIAAVAGSTTLVVDTSAVTTNSRIFLTYSVVGITPPANIATTITQPYVSAISNGVSFTISIGVGPVTNPINVFYMIVN